MFGLESPKKIQSFFINLDWGFMFYVIEWLRELKVNKSSCHDKLFFVLSLCTFIGSFLKLGCFLSSLIQLLLLLLFVFVQFFHHTTLIFEFNWNNYYSTQNAQNETRRFKYDGLLLYQFYFTISIHYDLAGPSSLFLKSLAANQIILDNFINTIHFGIEFLSGFRKGFTSIR